MTHNPLINETLLQMKFARVVSLLAKRLGITEEDALGIFYNSETYKNLSDTRNGLQNMSDAYLVDDIVMGLKNSFVPHEKIDRI